MAEKELGYVQLEWTCPNCGTRNPGPQKTCTGCGSPQPDQVAFEQAQQDKLITDQKEIEAAQKGADIHCPYCGTRNPTDAATCSQCSGDLKTGLRRESGRVVGAFQTVSSAPKSIACSNCNTLNPDTQRNCSACGASLIPAALQAPPVSLPGASKALSKTMTYAIVGGIGVLVILCIVICVFLSLKRSDVTGQVREVNWARSVAVEEFHNVTRQGWRGEIPASAAVGKCELKYHHTQDQAAPVATEVCGTPYKKDTGSGYAKVIQDCQYQVYQDFCSYTVQDWEKINDARLQGSDLNPAWPSPTLVGKQRLGIKSETYTIVFETSKGMYSYLTDDFNLFSRCRVGTQWTLGINAFNKVVSIEER